MKILYRIFGMEGKWVRFFEIGFDFQKYRIFKFNISFGDFLGEALSIHTLLKIYSQITRPPLFITLLLKKY